jgi:hypothetical protein
MAKDVKADVKVTEPATTSEDPRDVDWTYRLMSLERFDADPEDEDAQDIFAAKFQVDGPDANAEVEIIVSTFTDEANVISIALHTLHTAMTAWARITEDRVIAARVTDV